MSETSNHRRREKRWAEQGIKQADGSFLDWDTYQSVLFYQENRCALCGVSGVWTMLTADHDHKTGMFRGVLCFDCNHHALAIYEKTGKWKDAAHEALMRIYLEDPPYTKAFDSACDTFGFISSWWD